MLEFEVYRKRGKHWELLYPSLRATDSRKAALHASYVHSLKVIGVRPAGTNLKIFVTRLQHVATLTSA